MNWLKTQLFRAWTMGTSYDYRAWVGTLTVLLAYLLSPDQLVEIPAPWQAKLRIAKVVVGGLGLLLTAQGKPLIAEPKPEPFHDAGA